MVIRDGPPTPADIARMRADAYATLAANSEGTKVVYKETATDCLVELTGGVRVQAVITKGMRVQVNSIGVLVVRNGRLYFEPRP